MDTATLLSLVIVRSVKLMRNGQNRHFVSNQMEKDDISYSTTRRKKTILKFRNHQIYKVRLRNKQRKTYHLETAPEESKKDKH